MKSLNHLPTALGRRSIMSLVSEAKNAKTKSWREAFLKYHGLEGKWPWWIPDGCDIPGNNAVCTPVTTEYFSLWQRV